MVAHPCHEFTEGSCNEVALVSAKVFVEPADYKEALISLQAAEGNTATLKEIDSLTAYMTWELVPLPSGRRVVITTWVYKV
jgi:hypothetical protein